MMNIRALEEIQHITEISYQRAQNRYAEVMAEETALREELDRLQQLADEARTTSGQYIALATVGGDLLWQGWLGRSRAALNMALARVLAVKEQHLKAVRKSYGKLMIANELLANAKNTKAKAYNQSQLQQAIDVAVMQGQRQ